MEKHPFSIITVYNEPAKNFLGNTAAVVLLDTPWQDHRMQALAADLNQPATTFLWRGDEEGAYHVRWFAPDEEIGLCGHGSLAAIAFLSERFNKQEKFSLQYRNGKVEGEKDKDTCSITLAAILVISEVPVPELLPKALGIPLRALFTTDNKHILLANNEQDVRNMQPDFAQLRASKTFGYAVTAPGEEADFVSRTLVPHVKQLEDHATGSSHAALVPFWAKRLNKQQLTAYQLSPRGGKFICTLSQGNVGLAGNFSIVAKGEL